MSQLKVQVVTSVLPHEQVIFSGIQPTGTPHLGNYLGFILPFLDLQRNAPPESKIYLAIAGLHAITMSRDPQQLRNDRRDMLAVLIAAGVDPLRTCIYFQEDVPEHAELAWVLNAVCPVGKLMEMSTWKKQLATRSDTSVSSISQADLKLGLLAYPVLQAADILLYKSTLVPVGDDQSEHMVLTRSITETFNKHHKAIFPIPDALIVPSARITNLQNPSVKMSKSHPNPLSRILLTDPPTLIRSKLLASYTEALPPNNLIPYDPKTSPGISNLLVIWSALDIQKRSSDKLADEANEKGMSVDALKAFVAELVVDALGPVRERYELLRQDHDYLRGVAGRGRAMASEKARETMAEVRAVLGLDGI